MPKLKPQKFVLRFPKKGVHETLKSEAKEKRMSLNTLILEVLQEHIDHDPEDIPAQIKKLARKL